jgi:hypothetical protein
MKIFISFIDVWMNHNMFNNHGLILEYEETYPWSFPFEMYYYSHCNFLLSLSLKDTLCIYYAEMSKKGSKGKLGIK